MKKYTAITVRQAAVIVSDWTLVQFEQEKAVTQNVIDDSAHENDVQDAEKWLYFLKVAQTASTKAGYIAEVQRLNQLSNPVTEALLLEEVNAAMHGWDYQEIRILA